MLVVGITGGIGSGKGLATEFFRSRGAIILDADEIARELTRAGAPLLGEIAASFGREVLREDGGLDRRKLADVVFGRVELVERLNAISHPAIMGEMRTRLEELRREEKAAGGGERVVCVVAPLLLEAGGRGMVDRVLVLRAEEGERIRRVKERDGLSEEAVRKRMAAQMCVEEQAAQGDWVIDTTSGRESARARLEEVWAGLQEERRG